jgi:hypothetical protein
MDHLKKSQKDEYATAFAILALFDGGVSRPFVMCYGGFVYVNAYRE